jgi:hypothetical protein
MVCVLWYFFIPYVKSFWSDHWPEGGMGHRAVPDIVLKIKVPVVAKIKFWASSLGPVTLLIVQFELTR